MWPENWLPLQVFLAMNTQWRVGAAGATGLDYQALPVVEQRLGVKRRQRVDLFNAVQTIEHEVLRIWGEQRES